MDNLKQYNLKNGLKVILKDIPESTVSSVYVWVNTGSSYENDSERGLAHVHEHMIFKGTSKLGVGEISKKIEFLGGEVNAFTSFDETAYYATVSNDFVPEILDIFSQCMYDASFDSDELSKELEVILEEIKRGNDSPSNRLWDMVFKSVFSDNDYGLPIIGTPESVSNFKKSDVVDFYKKWYVASNMSLIIVGNLRDNIEKHIENYFSNLRSDDIPSMNKNFFSTQEKTNINFEKMDINETYFNISLTSPDASNLSYAAFDIFSSILGSGESSILYRKIKEELGLVTSISCGNYTLRHNGLFYITGTTNRDDVFNTIYKIIEILCDNISGNFDDVQLERVKTDILINDIYNQETVQSQARTIGSYISNNKNLDYLEKYKKKIADLNKNEIISIVSEQFKPENLNFNFLSPLKSDLKKPDNFQEKISTFFKFKENITNSDIKFKSQKYTIKKIDSSLIQEFNLDSGIKLISLQNEKTPLIALRAISLGGSSHETPENNGAFGLISEMFIRGSDKFSKDEIALKTEILGSEISGFSGRNSFGLKMIGPSDYLKKLVPIFGDVLLNPKFLDKEFEISKSDTKSYLSKLSKNSASVASDKFHELLFPNHPYGLNQFGSLSSIDSLNVSDVSNIYNEYLHKDNLALFAVGNFDTSELINELNKVISVNESNIVFPDLDNLQKIENNITQDFNIGDKQQSHIMIGTYAPNIKSEDRFAFHIINSVLSGMGGRLFIELRDKKSLAYTVTSFYTPLIEYGYFGAYIGCSPSKRDESIKEINNQIELLIENGISDNEIVRAKNSLIGKNDISLQRNSSISSRISIPYIYGLDPNEPFLFAENINNVDKSQINNAIKKYLQDAKFVSVSVNPN